MTIKTLTLKSAVKLCITSQECVLCMLHSWGKSVEK